MRGPYGAIVRRTARSWVEVPSRTLARSLKLGHRGPAVDPPSWPLPALQIDQAQARRRNHGLEFGVDLQLLDHVPHMPLDGVRCNPQTTRHGGRVKAPCQQVQDLQFPTGEPSHEPVAVLLLRQHTSLARDRLGEQWNWNQHLASTSPPDGFDDLV